MNQSWVKPLSIVFLLFLSGTSQAQQQCANCDCNQFPIEQRCEKCCGFASGKITSVTSSSVVISENGSTSDSVTVKKTFTLTPETKKNAALKEGALATVYYRKGGEVATKVDLVDQLSGLLTPMNQPDPPLPSSCARGGQFPRTH
jgi:hypothetical protein